MNGSPQPPVPDDLYPVWVAPPPPRRTISGFFTAYFAAGLALLLVGLIAVVVLVLRPGNDHHGAPAAAPGTSAGATSPSRVPSAGTATLGPQQLTMGKVLAVTGEDGAKFEVTVAAGKFRKTPCSPYGVKSKNGGYLPVSIHVKVLRGVPDVSEFDFRFQKPDGDWLDSVGGTGCETTGSTGLFRRLTAGRTYATSVTYDVPKPPLKGDIVFVWPLEDVIGMWKVG